MSEEWILGQETPEQEREFQEYESRIEQSRNEPLNTELRTEIQPTTMERLQKWYNDQPKGKRVFVGIAVNEALRNWLYQNGY